MRPPITSTGLRTGSFATARLLLSLVIVTTLGAGCEAGSPDNEAPAVPTPARDEPARQEPTSEPPATEAEEAPTGGEELAGLRSQDPEARRRAVEDFGRRHLREPEPPDPARLAAVTALLLEDPDSGVRSDAAWALGWTGPHGSTAVPALIRALEDPNQVVRANAVQALDRIGVRHPDLWAALQRALDDPYYEVRSRAATALGRLYGEAGGSAAPLVRALQDEDESVGRHAAHALRDLGGEAVEWILPVLRHPLPVARRNAVLALGLIGPDAGAAAPALRTALGDESPEVRALAGWALARTGATDPAIVRVVLEGFSPDGFDDKALETFALLGPRAAEAIPALTQAARAEAAAVTEGYEREGGPQAACALAKIGIAAVPVLVELLRDSDRILRGDGAWCLAEVEPGGEVSAVPDLLAALAATLDDPEPWVRAGAAHALGRHGGTAVALSELEEPPFDPPSIPPYDKGGRPRPSQPFPAAALAPGLASRIDRTAAAALVPALVRALRDPESDVAHAAGEALVRIGRMVNAWKLMEKGPRASLVFGILRCLRTERCPAPDEAAAEEAAGLFGSDPVVTALLAELEEAEDPYRSQLVSILGQMGSFAINAYPRLNAMGDADPVERARSEIAFTGVIPSTLAQTFGPAAIPVLARFLVDTFSDGTTFDAAYALRDLGAEGTAAVIALLDHDRGHVREFCARLLAEFGPEAAAAVPKLIALLARDPEPTVRRSAAKTLGQIGAIEAAEALRQASAGDADRWVREAAEKALVQLSPVTSD